MPLKTVAMANNLEALATKARVLLSSSVQVHVIHAETHIEFLDLAVNKGASVARLCTENLGIPLGEAVAFGDLECKVPLRLFPINSNSVLLRSAIKPAMLKCCARSTKG